MAVKYCGGAADFYTFFFAGSAFLGFCRRALLGFRAWRILRRVYREGDET